MTKEELIALGLTEEQIPGVFKINGIDVEKAKGDLSTKETELASIKEQLQNANTQIESFKEMDIETIKATADEYKQKYEQAQTEAKEKLEKIQFEHELENAIRDSKAKNVKAVKALLDIETLKDSKNRLDDIKTAIEATKTENDYLFRDVDPEGTGGSLINGDKGKKDPVVEDLGSALKDYYK